MAKRLKKKKTTAKRKARAVKRSRTLKRSIAAKKGWITRKKNQRKTHRILKALEKVTRRAIELKRKRVIKRKRKRPPSRVEYAVNVNYRVKGQTNAISIQFSVMAAPGLSSREVQDIIVDTIANEGESPYGTKVRIIDWKGGRVPHEIPWETLATLAHEPHTKFRVSQDGSR